MNRSNYSEYAWAAAFVLWIGLCLANIAAWITHWWVTIPQAIAEGATVVDVLLCASGIIAPIGVIHGWIIWFS